MVVDDFKEDGAGVGLGVGMSGIVGWAGVGIAGFVEDTVAVEIPVVSYGVAGIGVVGLGGVEGDESGGGAGIGHGGDDGEQADGGVINEEGVFGENGAVVGGMKVYTSPLGIG